MSLDLAESGEAGMQWTSITGQPLKLDTAPNVLGNDFLAKEPNPGLTNA